MQLIYLHHTERDYKSSEVRAEHNITKNGIINAELIGQAMKDNIKIDAIFTSPYLRCKRTAEIINEYVKAPLIEDNRLNEWNKPESKTEFLKRNVDAISDIVNKYKGTDSKIICVSSGVNLTAFVCHYYNIKINKNTKLINHGMSAPIIFDY